MGISRYIWVVAGIVLACGCDTMLKSRDAKYQNARPETYLKPPTPQAGARFGQFLVLDERSLVTSAPFETLNAGSDDSAENAGAIYVFDREHPNQAARRLVMPNAETRDGVFPGSRLPVGIGNEVDWGVMPIALNDEWMAVGVPGEDGGLVPGDDVSVAEAEANNDALEAGAVYLYRRSNLDEEPIYLKAPHPAEADLFGHTVTLSGDWLAVSASGESSSDPEDDTNEDAERSGALYLYRYDAERDEFVFKQYIKAPGIYKDDMFGGSVAIEGDLMVVAASGEDGTGGGAGFDDRKIQNSGAVYTYQLHDDHWEFDAYVKAAVTEPGDAFGMTVRLLDGSIAVGEPFGFRCPDSGAIPQAGLAYVVSRTEDGWTDFQCLNPPGRVANGLFGYMLGGSHDRLVVSAAWDPPMQAGAAYTYQRDADGIWQQGITITAPNRDEGDGFGAAIGVDGRTVAVGAFGESGAQSGPKADLANNDAGMAGAVYLFSME